MYKYLSVSLHLWLQQFLLIPQPNQYLRTGSMMIEQVCLNMHGKKKANPAPHACLFKTFHAWQHECSVMNADLDGASNLLITCWSENIFSIPFQAGSWHYHQREGVPSHFFLSSIGIKTVAQTTHAIKVYLYVWFMFDRSLFLFLLLFFLPAIHWCRLHMYIWKFKGIVCEKTFTVAPGLIGHWIFLWLDTLLLFLLGSCFSCCLLFICQWWFVAPDVKEKSALYWTDSILRSRPCTCQPIVHDRVILRDLDEVFHQFILLCPDEKWAYQTKKTYMPMSNVTHLDLQTHTHTHTSPPVRCLDHGSSLQVDQLFIQLLQFLHRFPNAFGKPRNTLIHMKFQTHCLWGPHSAAFLSLCGSNFSFKHAWVHSILGHHEDKPHCMVLGKLGCVNLLPEQQQVVPQLLERRLGLRQCWEWNPF